MCEHDTMEPLDELRPRVELWGCSGSECEYEEVRIYSTFDDYVVA